MRAPARPLSRIAAGALTRMAAGLLLLASAWPWAAAQATAGGGEPVRVAVAASLLPALQSLLRDWPGTPPALSSGASGVLAAQLRHGAPFDLFLSADRARPQALVAAGLARHSVTWAHGSLALWVHPRAVPAAGSACRSWLDNGAGRLAIANPRLAPYGTAALATLEALGHSQRFAGRLVRGQNVGQAWQMVRSGGAAAGLVALAQAQGATDGCAWVVPQDLHPPLEHAALVPLASPRGAAARELLAWLLSPAVQARLPALGFEPAGR